MCGGKSLNDLLHIHRNYVLAYGTLRQGDYNFTKIKAVYTATNDITYVKTIPIAGFKMYDTGQYPAAIYTGEKRDIMQCDILIVSNRVAEAIREMEIQAGYTEYSLPIKWKNHMKQWEANMTIYLKRVREEVAEQILGDHVHSGDWIKYKDELKAGKSYYD